MFHLHESQYELGCRKKDVSSENDFKDAVEICLPLINAAMRDIEKGIFPQSCFLSIEVPVSPSTNKVCPFWFTMSLSCCLFYRSSKHNQDVKLFSTNDENFSFLLLWSLVNIKSWPSWWIMKFHFFVSVWEGKKQNVIIGVICFM